ncbi:MAG: type IV secretion system DNA-binding domain-containing protein [Deltaproteobacteria bacterium]|nr:type IV secretion system DNA-binding domain-containing protein [Deltaproteobacteria bacterium]
MWGQLVRWEILGLVLTIILVPAVAAFRTTTGYEWRVVGMGTLAQVKLALGYDRDSGQAYEWREGRKTATRIVDIAADPRIERIRRRLLDTIYGKAWMGLGLGAGAMALFTLLFWIIGRRMERAKRLRGAEMATARELRRRVQPFSVRLAETFFPAARRASCRIAGIPWPERAETQHTIVSGTTGSGKTVLISDLVAQIRARGERCIVYDKMGTYTRSFFDPARDVLMNPLDARAPRWSPFFEARTPRDFDMMAAALIPQQKDTVDPFWVTAARQLFSNGAGVLWRDGVTENRRLVDELLKTELAALAQAMEGTVAQSIVSPENPKTALSVRAMLTANLGALEFLPDTGMSFSIREWVGREDETGFLFLTSRGDQHASLRGLISTWLEIAVNALLSLHHDDARRIWLVLDELPPLHQVPSLQPGLAESRQFGGCFVLGIQVFSSLRDIYGRNGAETISGLCGTRVVLSAPDQETAQWSAESLGRGEVEEYTHGMSYGASTMRDGVSLTQHRQMRPLALPSEIMRLENLHGYLKFPGPFPVTSIELRYVDRPASAERFVAREGDAANAETDASTPDGEPGDGDSGLVDERVEGEDKADPPAVAPVPAGVEERGDGSRSGAEPRSSAPDTHRAQDWA